MNSLHVSCLIFGLRSNDRIELDNINKLYKKMACQEHPDKHIDNVELATKRFQKLGAAYALLLKRIEYGKIIVPDFTKIQKENKESTATSQTTSQPTTQTTSQQEYAQETTSQQEYAQQTTSQTTSQQEDETIANIQKYSNPELQKMYEQQVRENEILKNVFEFICKEFSQDVSKYTESSINRIIRKDVTNWNIFILQYKGTKKQKIYVNQNLIQKLWRNC